MGDLFDEVGNGNDIFKPSTDDQIKKLTGLTAKLFYAYTVFITLLRYFGFGAYVAGFVEAFVYGSLFYTIGGYIFMAFLVGNPFVKEILRTGQEI
jgi:hypothetical protein